jgi:hypothetical protein
VGAVYSRESVGDEWRTWPEFRSLARRRMKRITGPATIVTQEGQYDLPDGWDGWVAFDSAGYPYPIAADEQAATYVPVEAT